MLSLFLINQRNSTLFAFSLFIEGTTEKVLQFIMPLKVIDNIHWTKNVFLNTTEKFKQEKNLLIDIIFATEKRFLMTFSELPPIGLY